MKLDARTTPPPVQAGPEHTAKAGGPASSECSPEHSAKNSAACEGSARGVLPADGPPGAPRLIGRVVDRYDSDPDDCDDATERRLAEQVRVAAHDAIRFLNDEFGRHTKSMSWKSNRLIAPDRSGWAILELQFDVEIDVLAYAEARDATIAKVRDAELRQAEAESFWLRDHYPDREPFADTGRSLAWLPIVLAVLGVLGLATVLILRSVQ